MQNIDNVNVYFDADGKQVKGHRHVNGSTYHFEKDSGQLTRSAFASDKNGNWYYLGQDGKHLSVNKLLTIYHSTFTLMVSKLKMPLSY